jgi:hypothetical protein
VLTVLSLGMIIEVASMRAELAQRIDERNVKYPLAFQEILQYTLKDTANGRVLVLPPGTEIKGDLEVDWTDEFAQQRIVAIVARGDLRVEGTVRNADLDGGPLLFVAGNLRARHIDKGGAFFVILGNVELDGVAVCEYNHGGLRVGGDLKAQALLQLDHDVLVCGKTVGCSLSEREDDLREALVPEVFDLADDPEATSPDGRLLRKRIAAGLPILRGLSGQEK